MCYKGFNVLVTAGEIFNFFFLRSRIGFYISVLEQKYVQDISRVYIINKWSYVQIVNDRSFYENELGDITNIAVENDAKTYEEHNEQQFK